MDNRIYILITVLLILAASLANGAVIDKIIAVVNDDIILQSELEESYAPLKAQYEKAYEADQLHEKLLEAKKGILNQLIDDKLLIQEAKRVGFTAEEERIDFLIDNLKKKFPTQEKFEEALTNQGFTLSKLREKYRDQIIKQSYIDRAIRMRIEVKPVEVEEYYEAHKEDFMEPEEYKASHILIKKEGNEVEAEKIANEVLEKLRAGADFTLMAKEYSNDPNASDGGNLGFLKRGEMIPEFEQTLLELKVGDVSEIVKTRLGYQIIRLDARKEPKVKELPEVKNEIEQILSKDKMGEKYKEIINKLKKTAYVDIKDEELVEKKDEEAGEEKKEDVAE